MDTDLYVYGLFIIIAGLAFTIYGMNEMSQHLEKLTGSRIEKILKKITRNPLKSIALGTGITVLMQSSSALASVLTGLVNSGVMELSQTVGLIMGSNIGTTFTLWITGLVPITEPAGFYIIGTAAVAGIIMKRFSSKDKINDTGTIVFSASILFVGIFLMTMALVAYVPTPISLDSSRQEQYLILQQFLRNPVFCVFAGMLITMILQSSSVSVAALQAFSITGVLPLESAVFFIVGQNIGTSVSSFISSHSADKNARRVSFIHLFFNLTGGLLTTAAVWIWVYTHSVDERTDPVTAGPLMIAAVHTGFNVITSLVLIPFSSKLEKLAILVIKGENEKSDDEKKLFIDERLLETPSFALTECRSFAEKMAALSLESYRDAFSAAAKFDAKTAEKVLQTEDLIDDYEDKLGTYLIKLSGCSLTKEDAALVSRLLHCIGDFERISDHAAGLVKIYREMNERKIRFSHAARIETEILQTAVADILEMSVNAFINNDADLARRVEPLEEVINGLRMELKNRHLRRLQQDKCTTELGFIFSDLLTNLERISDHCSNIAVCLIQLKDDKFDTHEYITNIKENDKDFQEMRFQYVEKYSLPD
ncbi:Na/Pi cotransporter family protein [Ruminococcus sp. HUN007]|uniref:Na/Pi cotransporter family protein n=1 Tax=Ruminococcus sp. HUN007 TaxID=1514668 RepID=UPI0005D1430A|nr:Na/Pi cotransporter family protein [Ruminococcus sp. HUN007]